MTSDAWCVSFAILMAVLVTSHLLGRLVLSVEWNPAPAVAWNQARV